MSKLYSFALVILVSISVSTHLSAQCSPSAPAEGSCSGGNGAATDGANINNNQTYWYSGTGTFQNGVNLNSGGTLRVCGNLTLNQINLNGGTIIVTSGATLTINGGGTLNLNNNVMIANYGTLNINRDVLFQNNGNTIINATISSVINMPNYKMTVSGPNTSSGNIFINKGTINLHTLEVTANSNGVCLGNQSVIDTKYYINSKDNAITVEPGAVAVLRFTQNGQNNAALTSHSGLHVCKAPGATFTGTNTGSATIYDNCTSAAVALPVTLTDFQVKTTGAAVQVSWETEQEADNHYFIVEHSTDGIHFETGSAKVDSKGKSGGKYSWLDAAPAPGKNYYRLLQVDVDGASQYLGIRAATVAGSVLSAQVYPNPADERVVVSLPQDNENQFIVTLLDINGKQVLRNTVAPGTAALELDLSHLPSGPYYVMIAGERSVQSIKVVKR